ncbi:4816_t:CDS:1 [Cetraspora pellucida]|uniref:4816_t:CDS:1 n=1 Tax=Cetraspora pellucida TaxID=1433469 RepID=A0ACA9LCK1_9GLOM|nr:4816_t:CDS:1 [Cetraspora pellucida]
MGSLITPNPIFIRSIIQYIICSLLILLASPVISVPVSSPTQVSVPNMDGNQSSNPHSDNDNMNSNYSSEITKFILIVISIVILVELVFWLFKFVNKMRGRNFSPNDGQITNVTRVRNENGFDTASTAGSVDEYLPPYDGLSLPKYVEFLEGSNANTVVGEDEANVNTIMMHGNGSDEGSVVTVGDRSEEDGNRLGEDGNTTNSSNSNQSGVTEIINNEQTAITLTVEMTQVPNIDNSPGSLTSTQTSEQPIKSEG